MEREFISIGESLGLDKKPIVGDPPPNPPNPPNPTDPPPGDPPPNPPAPPPADFQGAFEASMKTSNPEFKLDEKYATMTDIEKFNYVKENLTPAEAKPHEDPFIASYLKAKESGVGVNDFIQQQNVAETIRTMSSRDFLINDLMRENGQTEKNPDGWTKEDIETEVDTMSKIKMDLAAKERKQTLFAGIEQQNQQAQIANKELIKTQSEEANSGYIKETIDKLFMDMSEITEIGGIPHSKEDQEIFKQMFTDTVSINPETGYPRTKELFNDDKVLYEVLYLYNKIHGEGEGSLKNFLSSFKEEYKQEILDKSRLSPRKEGGHFKTTKLPKSDDYV